MPRGCTGAFFWQGEAALDGLLSVLPTIKPHTILSQYFLELCHGQAAQTQAPAELATAAKMNVLRHQRRLHMCGTWKFGFGTWLGACISFVFIL